MKQVQVEPHVLETAGAFGLLDTLQTNNEMLETVNTGVNNYLEQKRLYFPRYSTYTIIINISGRMKIYKIKPSL